MTVKKFLVIAFGIFFINFAQVSAWTRIEINSTVAVMDFEPHESNSDTNLDLMNAEKTSSEYVTNRLAESKKFTVIDRYKFEDELKDLDTLGLISPDDAKKIGEILGVKYIVYGNVTDVSVATDNAAFVNVNRVRAHLIIRIMEVETGKIIMAARGQGDSESSFIGDSDEKFITIGTIKVTQTSVHNALQKASFQAVDILIERLFGKKK